MRIRDLLVTGICRSRSTSRASSATGAAEEDLQQVARIG